jgi:hypothetical protein
MFKFVRSCSLFAALSFCLAVTGAHAQSDAPVEHKQFDRMDLGLSAPYELTKSSAGNSSIGPVSQSVSSASGVLATFRYTKSPWVGFEMNYKRSRMTQNYIYSAIQLNPAPPPTTIVVPTALGVESNVIETSWGYVAHAPSSYFGLKPFGGVGVGSIEFKPTKNGGQGLLRQFRAVYYWDLGADYTFGASHFGARVAVRQLFYLAPDFGQNYLTSGARTHTLEPTIGFFARF